MNKFTWIAIAVLGIVVVFVFLGGIYLFGGWNYGNWGMMGSWGPGMMHGLGFGPFGWIGMVLMWLIPIGILALVVLGIIGLVRGFTSAGQSTSLPHSPTEDQPSALEILQLRYARGEINREQYMEILSDIN